MSLLSIFRPCRQILIPTRSTLRCYSATVEEKSEGSKQESAPAPVEDENAYNTVEKKKGKIKPLHTVEEQIGYMKSKAFENAYKGLPIYKWYRRNLAVQKILQPPPRLFCIDKEGRFKMNNACPVCRDEYLFFDYRNPELIKQFLVLGTDKPITILQSGLCREQYANLQAQLLKAREHGTMEFSVEFRVFDYAQYYPEWQADATEEDDEQPVSRNNAKFQAMLPDQMIKFPAHRRDRNDGRFWERHAEFARKAK